jgi:hypothetical protein
MDDGLGPDDLEAVSRSPRATDRLTWHLFVCRPCQRQEPCRLGEVLAAEAELVAAAIVAFQRCSPEQQKLLADDLKTLAWEGF